MDNLKRGALGIDLMISELVDADPGITHAAVISTDGRPLATTLHLAPGRAELLASYACELLKLAWGAATGFNAGSAHQVMIEMGGGVLLTQTINDHLGLAVLADPECDLGNVAWHITHVANEVRKTVTPEVQKALHDTRFR
ncbi:roadblock/LC7 domain-containing protein [Nonomuraea sp. NPDC049695]|uniref:roadblock/LC7 domain-containing protein n=1 Tax=Nonomuraea sp. NPDC049695 TaxID=3154734 RepID=UPI00343CFCBD